MTEAENALLERIHDELHCSPRITTSLVNGDPADFEVAVTWTRTLRMPGYSLQFGEDSVRAGGLEEALSKLLEAEQKHDADLLRYLLARVPAEREKTP
jgi:hypothetical protein